MAKVLKFEDALSELEACVRKIENDELNLEEAFKVYESGVKNAARCQKALEQIENKIELLQRDPDGNLHTTTTAQEQLRDK
ncbi:MAG: exodeoxyribonuclease VII small subunit [Desulfuromonadaceae bacterium]|jgi:exodeoxyribonuclease VII small subunit|nr:exodeoxyribonuclease VII small subunit [Desulfuromonas sp.]MDY0184735.1 exodeoxyribonuclease VII small subunit [Desulfuromonadaceae bacterium]